MTFGGISIYENMYCHAELVSASVRGEGVAKARVEILKQVQDDVWCIVMLNLVQHLSASLD